MRSKRKNARARLRVLKGAAAVPAPAAASGPASAPAPAAPPGPEQLDELDKLREQQELVDRHRGQRSEQLARHARETAEQLTRHVDEEKALAEAQQREVAQLWRRHGRELAGWQVRVLGGSS
jgi:choline dehydrogenase-like flavoprotein